MGSIDVDGPAILRAIIDNPEAFPDISTEIIDFSRKLVTAQLKAKTTSLSSVQAIYRAIGEKDLERILDGVPDAQIKTLVKRFDTNNAEIATATPQWHRKHLLLLASGAATQVAKPAAAARKAGSAKKAKLSPEQADAKKSLSARTIKLGEARNLWQGIGAASFATVLDNMTEKQIEDLAKRLDPDYTELAIAPIELRRNHIVALAAGKVEPRSVTESAAHTAARRRASKTR